MSKFDLFDNDELIVKDIKKTTSKNINIIDLIPNTKKVKKEQIGIHLPSEYVDKLKTIAETKGISMSKLFEDLLSNLLKDIKIDKKLVNTYNARNKGKGKRNK